MHRFGFSQTLQEGFSFNHDIGTVKSPCCEDPRLLVGSTTTLLKQMVQHLGKYTYLLSFQDLDETIDTTLGGH